MVSESWIRLKILALKGIQSGLSLQGECPGDSSTTEGLADQNVSVERWRKIWHKLHQRINVSGNQIKVVFLVLVISRVALNFIKVYW